MTENAEISRGVVVANCGAPTIQAPRLAVWMRGGYVEIDCSSSSACAMVPLDELDLEPGVEGSVVCKAMCQRFRKDVVTTEGGANA